MSRARDIADLITAAIEANTIQSDGTITGTPTKVNTHDSDGALLAADSSGYADGSLHYMTTPRKLMLWDDSDGGFFEMTVATDQLTAPWSIQGSNYGYAVGGTPGVRNEIEKYSYVTDGNATDVGDTAIAYVYDHLGHSSLTHGYLSGGEPSSRRTRIERFAFASDGNASLMSAVLFGSGIRGAASSSTESHGYIHGHGQDSPAPTAQKVQRFAYASDEDAAETGDADDMGVYSVGHSSATHGYAAAGFSDQTAIFKYAFGSSTTMSDVGDLPTSTYLGGSQSDQINGYGYVSGGHPTTNAIRRFSFSSDGNATDYSDLHTAVRYNTGGTQSTVSGYSHMGQNSNIIQKFPFSNNNTGTDVGDLTVARHRGSGNQI
jgi:hypothetical protein